MQEELSGIDTSSIEALKTLKDEHDVLDGRIKAMEEIKESVAAAVYVRVHADYATRLEALQAQSRPLKEQAREQYANLKRIVARLEADTDAVKLDKQEVELRHQLGEFDKKEFERRVKAIDIQAAEKGELHQRAQELKARFVASVHAESELETAAPAPAPAPLPPTKSPYSTDQLGVVATSQLDQASVRAAIAARQAAPPPPGPEMGTMVMPSMKAPPAPTSDATVMFRPARLVPQNPEAGKTTFSLSLKPMTLGSDARNDVRLSGTGVESKHAQINPTPQGFLLLDLDTKTGTRVNNERIGERLLAHEDVVQIGAARFVFRSS